MDYHDIVERLRRAKANIRCSELKEMLNALGFDVQDGRRGNHKIVKHPGLVNFIGSDYDCGHGRDPLVKSGYIGNIIRVLENYEEPLKRLHGGTS